MALDVLVGATAASLLELAGTSLSGLAGTATFKEWLSGCTFRAKAGRLQPGNHDLVRGVRTAHLAALRAVASRHRRVLGVCAAEALGQRSRLGAVFLAELRQRPEVSVSLGAPLEPSNRA